jgi:hypothetical protein
MDARMNAYRLLTGLAVAVLFAVQHTVAAYLTGTSRTVAGYAASLGFFAAVAEFATLSLGRRLAKGSGGAGDRVSVAGVFAIASLLLVFNLVSKTLSAYLALQRLPPPTVPLLVLVGWWVAMIGWVRWRGRSPRSLFVAFAGLVLGTRVLVLWVSPFDRLLGDMLPTIDRALGELLAGRFPYVDFPPPMPYLPGTFLAYAPPKLLGCDIRVTNLALDVAAVAAVMLGPGGSREGPHTAPSAGRVALPFFMLHPVWTYASVNTHFSPSVFTAVLLARAVTSAGPRTQAVALGLAVGSNQMLGACGPILFGHWLGRYAPRRAFGLAGLSVAVFVAQIAPFLLWKPGPFLEVAFLNRRALPPEFMSGRFTLLPLVSGIGPHAGVVLSLVVLFVAVAYAMRAQGPETVVAAMAMGLCGTLLLQPVSFSHYFLPVIALVAAAPMPIGEQPGRGRVGRTGPAETAPDFRESLPGALSPSHEA